MRRAGLGAMALALAAYVALHTPLRNAIADALGISSRGCYLCARSVSGSDLAHSAAAAVLVAAAGAGAAATASRFSGTRYERPLVFGAVMTALATVPAAAIAGLASLAGGTYLEPPAGPLLAAIPALVVTAVAVGRGWRPALPSLPAGTASPLLIVVGVCAAAVLAGTVVVSLLHPPSQGDALTYHAPLGVFFWSDGNLTAMLDRSPETWAFAHPGTAELWYGLLRLLGGERLADLGQVPFALLGGSAAYAAARRTSLEPPAAALAACAFVLIPLVVLQSGTQANDVAAGALLMTAIALASAPVATWTADRVAAIGLALGLTAATKLALLPGVAVVGIFAVAVLVRTRPQRMRAIATFALAFLVAVAPWWVRNVVREGNPIFPQSLPLLGRGVNVGALGQFDFEYVPRRAAWPLYPFFEPIDDRSGYGALIAIATLPGLAAAWVWGRRRPVALLVATFVATVPLWWTYTLHEPRFLLPYAGLAAVFVPWSLRAVPSHRRRAAAAVIGAAAAFSVALVADQGILPLARQPVDRAAFYDRVWAVDPTALSLPERDGVLQTTGYGLDRVDYASTYPLLGGSQRRLVVSLDADTIRGSSAVVRQRMRHARIRFAYVAAVPAHRAEVERLFQPPGFRLVHESAVTQAERIGARRRLFRPAARPGEPGTITRYLFRLER